jgi:hypothetical protein
MKRPTPSPVTGESAESNVGGVLMERAAAYIRNNGHVIPHDELADDLLAEFPRLIDEQVAELALAHAEVAA